MTVDVVLAAGARLGEGPVWDARTSRLRWVDILLGRVHRFDPVTGADEFFEVGEDVGTVAVRRGGGLVLATRTGIVTCADDGAHRTVLHSLHTDPVGRSNDGKADPWGRFWAGTMVEGPGTGAALYRLDPDGSLSTMVTGVACSNGLGWSPDGRTMYYVDTGTGGLDAFDHDPATGAISGRRRLASVDRGMPDGLTVDAEGCVWVALWDGWGLHRYSPSGTLLSTVDVPTQRVTSCTFGGMDLSTLYITSARDGLPSPSEHAGSLFAFDPGVTGLLAGEWAG